MVGGFDDHIVNAETFDAAPLAMYDPFGLRVARERGKLVGDYADVPGSAVGRNSHDLRWGDGFIARTKWTFGVERDRIARRAVGRHFLGPFRAFGGDDNPFFSGEVLA